MTLAAPIALRLRRRLTRLRLTTLAAAIVAGLGFGVAAPARAQVDLGAGLSLTGTVAGTTDYLFRGISQTRNRPTVQGTLELSHESGVYIGAFLSGVAFQGGYDARQELDLTAGYRFEIGPVKFDTYVIGYTYPGYTAQPGFQELAYLEVGARGTIELGDFTLTAAANYSPNYFGRSGSGVYIEGGVDYKVPVLELVLSGRLGYQFIERPARFGITPDSYLYYGVSVSREIAYGITASVGYYGTDLSERECGGLKICNSRFLASLTLKF
ncbi:TorF family putative porin [Plastoroseomonas arctica]|uniref:Uncharacterized protein n=1 Tax=Plastoroseomonas arctica TaxID=1509237 RepID=A0AAF1KN14_9PROT|nr:TorF family putative porin [Plastoroseomonas arctica]MBR0656114.1 hypothetical protein [Plastoroseomonas arctica]